MIRTSYMIVIFIPICWGSEIVTTLNGQIKGFLNYTEEGNVPYYVYFGIPYAEKPLNEKRFEPPTDVKNWTGVLDCTKPSPKCIQVGTNGVIGSEDCLYLNLYIPQECFLKKCPILAFIHGGGFIGGSNSYNDFYPGHFIDTKVIVALMNYRLNVLGFLSTCDLKVPGNMGLKDQNCALRWIQKNIQFFGGDPNQVTIGGESAGAASVGYHEQCPSCAGTFLRTFKQSGNTLNIWALTRKCQESKHQFFTNISNLLRVNVSSITIDLLKTLDPGVIQIAGTTGTYANLLLNIRDGTIFGPVSEVAHNGSFFTGNSYNDLDKGLYPIKPVTETLIAFGSEEFTSETSGNQQLILQTFFGIEYLDVKKFVPKDVIITNPIKKTNLGSEIKNKFFPGLTNTVLTATPCDFSNYFSFEFFLRGSIKNVQLLTKHGRKVYLLQWSYMMSNVETFCPGVPHSLYLSAFARSWKSLSAQDKEYSKKFVQVIGNFVISGNPTPPATEAMFNEPFEDATYEVTGDNYNMYDLGVQNKNIQGFKKQYMDFYKYVFNQSESFVINTY